MKKLIGLIGIILFTFNGIHAQMCYDVLQTEEDIKVKYKWKENESGEKELRIKFKTTAKSDLNMDLELGFYHNGILEEKAQINDCLKKFFWNDWFRPIHLIQFENLTKEQIESDQFKLEILDLKTERVDECIETDD
ncbi:MAG: hypothetical protein WD530_00435 [Vicingaceae bacterium]